MAKIDNKENEKIKWYAETAEFALQKTEATENGLSQEEATQRLKKFGENTLPQKKPKPFILMLLKEFLNPIVMILLVAMAFSFAVGELLDGFVILGIILIDAIIGAVQEKRAERVASSLSNMIKVKTKVLRDGQKMEIEANDERNHFIRNKAWAWAGYLFVMIMAVATIVFKIIGQDTLMMFASGSVCLVLVLFWVSYHILKRKY